MKFRYLLPTHAEMVETSLREYAVAPGALADFILKI